MDFDLEKSLQILERTPVVLTTMLSNISSDWTSHNEGGETWSVYDVVGHLVHGEHSDWISRVRMILEHGENKTFHSFNRVAMFEESKGKDLQQLLAEFASLRSQNIDQLKSLAIGSAELSKKGKHPDFGEVTLAQLLSTWTAHDLTHLAQINRVMAKQYKSAIGPWIKYFRVVSEG